MSDDSIWAALIDDDGVPYLETIAEHLHQIRLNTAPDETNMETAYAMLIGVTTSAGQQINEAMDEPDLMKRAQMLRGLADRCFKMGKQYQANLDAIKAGRNAAR
jgi:hypothetical protein